MKKRLLVKAFCCVTLSLLCVSYSYADQVSASMKRWQDKWQGKEAKDNEFYSTFKYSPATGLGYEEGVSRRDPSTIIKADGVYYVYYTRSPKTAAPVGYEKATDKLPANTWDLASIFYATSNDGRKWVEQGAAVTPGQKGSFDDRSVFTPEVMAVDGKYYLFYQAVKSPFNRRTRNVIAMAWATSPKGPWTKAEQPMLMPGNPGVWDGDTDDRSKIKQYGDFDSLKVHDPCLIKRDGKYWLYYKAHPMGVGGSRKKPYPDFSMGLAIANKPEGPYIKSNLNPVSCSGHEVLVWPYKAGVASLVTLNGPEKNTVQFSEDGMNFHVKSHVILPPSAAGAYRPDAYINTKDGQGITWGLSTISQTKQKPWSSIIRFECDLSKAVSKAQFKRENVRFTEETLFNNSNRIRSAKTQSKSQPQIPYWLAGYSELYRQYPRRAAQQWFRDAKFGMFVHLALASLCENGKADYVLWKEGKASDRLLEFVGVSKQEYEATENKDQLLYEKYLLADFDAEDICKLAVKAKMKYINFTTLHLGRCFNFDTKVSSFTCLNAPCKRDLVAEMAAACKKYGLALFLYLPPQFAQDNPEKGGFTRQKNLAIIKELLTNYGQIAGIWFDGIGYFFKNPDNYMKLTQTFDYIRSIQPHCLVSFKEGAICDEDFLSPEHFMLPFEYNWDTTGRVQQWQMRKERWDKQNAARWEKCNKYKLREVNTVMQECFNRDAVHVASGWINDESARHLTGKEVYDLLEYARFTGSNLMMNIGPRADGSVHPDDVRALEGVGKIIEEKGWPKLLNRVQVK